MRNVAASLACSFLVLATASAGRLDKDRLFRLLVGSNTQTSDSEAAQTAGVKEAQLSELEKTSTESTKSEKDSVQPSESEEANTQSRQSDEIPWAKTVLGLVPQKASYGTVKLKLLEMDKVHVTGFKLDDIEINFKGIHVGRPVLAAIGQYPLLLLGAVIVGTFLMCNVCLQCLHVSVLLTNLARGNKA